ncbi:MAG TPA: hypothetical protein VM488_11030 [Pseudobacter sp.]|nr:hypothetical protein [Pseudobacter sp.]
MKIKFKLINYYRFVKKILPQSVLWHRHEWEDNITSRYYGRYADQHGKKKDQYYLEINQVVYSLHTVEDLVNLDHELFMNRLSKGGSVQTAAALPHKLTWCSICTHKDGCPLMKKPYPERKRQCLFIPVVYLLPACKMEVENLRPASSRLITEMVMHSVYAERVAETVLEKITPVNIYQHTFTFAQLQ